MDAGKIMMLFKGEYDSTTQYEILDVVRKEGALYGAKKDLIGIEPAGETDDNWMLLMDGKKVDRADKDGNGDNIADTYQKKTEPANQAVHDSAGNKITETYLQKTETAEAANKDGAGNVIKDTYLKKTEPAQNAINDNNGNNIAATYQKKTEAADRAIHDSEGNEFAKTYLKRNSIDNILSNKSTNPPQNQVVAEAIAGASIASTGGGQSTSVTLNPLYKYLLMSGTASSPVIYFVYYEGDKWYCGNGNATFGSFSGNTFTFGSAMQGGSCLYKI